MKPERRMNYRKNLRVTGYLTHDGGAKPFFTRNISLTGVWVHFDDYQGMYKDIIVPLRLPTLQIKVYVYPIWQKPADDGGFDMGLKFFMAGRGK